MPLKPTRAELEKTIEALEAKVALNKKLEDELRESEEKFRTIFENANDEIIYVDKNGIIIDVNDKIEDIFGWKREECIGKSYLDLNALGPESLIKNTELVEDLIFGKPPRMIEVEGIRKDGSIVIIEVSARLIKKNNELEGVIVIIRDLTDRRRSEKALRKNEERYRLLAENSTDIIWTMTLNGRFLYVSPSVTRITGFTIEDVINTPLKDYVTPDSYALIVNWLEKELKKTSDQRNPYTILEVQQRVKDGSLIDIEMILALVYDKSGDPFYLQGSSRDITERKHAEIRLRESENKFKTIFEHANDEIVLIDSNGIVVDVNGKVENIFGYTREEVIGKNFHEFSIINEDSKIISTYFAEALDGHPTQIIELEAKHKNGTSVFIEVSTTILTENNDVRGMLCIIRDITNRKLAEEELRRSEEKFKMIFENANDVIVIVDNDGRLSDLNRKVYDVFGYKPEESIGKLFTEVDFLKPEDLDKAAELFGQVVSGTPHPMLEIEGKHKNGDTIYIEVNPQIIMRGENILGILAIIRDITVRKHAEAERRESEEKLKTIFDNANDAIIYFNSDITIIDANKKVFDIFGYRPEEIKGRRLNEFNVLKSEEQQNAVVFFQEIINGEPAPMMDFEAIKKDGSKIFIETSASLIKKGDAPLGIIIIVRDITERKIAALALQKNERLLLNAQRIANLGTWELDFENNMLIWSDELYRLYRRPKKNAPILIEDWIDIIHPDDIDSVSMLFEQALAGNADFSIDHRIICMDGEIRHVHAEVEVTRDEYNKPIGVLGTAIDITDRKKYEEALKKSHSELELWVEERTAELRKTNQELRKAKEAADAAAKAKSEFLANMSHEIRTPLNAILGMTDLYMKTELNRKQKKYLNTIRSSSTSLLNIINDILDFSKIDAGRLDLDYIPFSPRDVIEEVADMFFAESVEKDIEFVVDIFPDVPSTVVSDPLRLRQVLVNLTSNAFKFTEKGEICISVQNKSTDKGFIELLFCVRDTGIGIDTNQQDRLFDAFAQADGSTTRKYGGTGLGLAICKKLVKIMGGNIWIESEEGSGSSFFFNAKFKTAPAHSPYKYPLPPDIQNLKVLIVDDNITTLKVLKRYIELFGLKTYTSSSAEHALSIYEKSQTKEPFGLILMDIRMPDMDGITLSKKIIDTSQRKPPPIIIVTAYGNDQEIYRANKIGVDSILVKPIKPSLLYETIMEVFGYKQKLISNADTVSHAPAQRFTGTSVLIVEDEPINQMVAAELLESVDIMVTKASSGAEAIKMIKNSSFDAVLMDVQMPEIDGIEATKHIRKEKKFMGLPIIAMTAGAMDNDKEKCFEAGMNDYISKPIDPEQFYSKLSRWLSDEKDVFISYKQNKRIQKDVLDSGLPEILPGIDVKSGLKRLNGNKSLYIKILSDFYSDNYNTSIEIRNMLNKNDKSGVMHLAHALKGIAGNISAYALQEKAKELLSGIDKDTNDRNRLFTSFENELNKVLNSISSLEYNIRQSASRIDKPENKPESTANTVKDIEPLIVKLDQLLQNNDLAADEHLESIITYLQIVPKEDLQKLEAHIDKFEYYDARRVLNNISNLLGISLSGEKHE